MSGLLFLSLFAGALWIYLAFARDRFWWADQKLPAHPQAVEDWPEVCAIIPARNEAETVQDTLNALAAQDYPGRLSIILVNDNSEDGTGDLARAVTSTRHTLHVVDAPPLEPGWIGKMWAVHQGVEAVATLAPDAAFFWLTDADIHHPPQTLLRLAAKAATGPKLVSLMVKLRCQSLWEKLLVPAFIYFFQMLYPFPAANDPARKVAAAAGGCILVERQAFQEAGGIPAIKDKVIDDCSLAALIKGQGHTIWLGLADESHSTRAYQELQPFWDTVKRTAFTQLGHSWFILAFTMVMLFVIFLWPVIGLALSLGMAAPGSAALCAAALALMMISYAPTLRDYNLKPGWALLLPGVAMLFAGMTLDSGIAHARGQGAGWKARTYDTPGRGTKA